MRSFISIAATIATLTATVNAISKISIKGSKFFTEDGNQFFVKGVAYQLLPEDPLLDGAQCARDAALMKDLGANAIRVYHVEGRSDHTDCMKTFADAGIYLFVDLDTFHTQIEQTGPPHWNQSQLSSFTQVLDEFVKYDNTAGVFVGNEVITTSNGSFAAPFIKAAARDVKTYRDSKGYRKVPVGYSAADISELRPMLQNYLACGANSADAIDFFALNAYEWCGPSSFATSGYNQLTVNITDYSIPIFFSETGCNTNRPRDFGDQRAIFGPDMAPYWSGAIVYEWIEETNNYGLVSYGTPLDPVKVSTAPPDGFSRTGTPIPITPDFSNLKSQWAAVTPSGVRAADYSPNLTPPACPSATPGVWNVDGAATLPPLGATATVSGASTRSTGTGTQTSSAPTSSKTGSASGGKEIAGMTLGLASVMLIFIWWM